MAEGRKGSGKASSRRSSGRAASTPRRRSTTADSSSGKGSSRKPSAAAKRGSTRKSSGAAARGSGRSASAGSATRASRSAGSRRSGSSRRAAADPPAEQVEVSGKTVAELRDALARGVIAPLGAVMLTRDRIEEVMEDAVFRGRVTRDDARDLVQSLLARGRKQTNDVLSDLEALLAKATSRARESADPLLVQADRARRAAGVGRSFPISAYEDLTAAQVRGRLDTLTPPELRKVRDYERRNANRKSVLKAIETKLG